MVQKGDNPPTERGTPWKVGGSEKRWHLPHKPRDTGGTPCTPMSLGSVPGTTALSL